MDDVLGGLVSPAEAPSAPPIEMGVATSSEMAAASPLRLYQKAIYATGDVVEGGINDHRCQFPVDDGRLRG